MKGFLFLKSSFVGIVVILLLASIGWLQFSLDTLHDRPVDQIEASRNFPRVNISNESHSAIII